MAFTRYAPSTLYYSFFSSSQRLYTCPCSIMQCTSLTSDGALATSLAKFSLFMHLGILGNLSSNLWARYKNSSCE